MIWHPFLSGMPITSGQLQSVMKEGPHGGTPLTESVEKLIADINPVSPLLSSRGQQVVVIIATDGEYYPWQGCEW